MIKFPTSYLMGNIYELYYFYPTCIASGFIYELNYLYPAPSASGKHLLLLLVYTVHPNLSTCFFKFRNIFTISWLIICRNLVVKYKFEPSKSLENALFSAFYFSKFFIVGNTIWQHMLTFCYLLSLFVLLLKPLYLWGFLVIYTNSIFVLFCHINFKNNSKS